MRRFLREIPRPTHSHEVVLVDRVALFGGIVFLPQISFRTDLFRRLIRGAERDLTVRTAVGRADLFALDVLPSPGTQAISPSDVGRITVNETDQAVLVPKWCAQHFK